MKIIIAILTVMLFVSSCFASDSNFVSPSSLSLEECIHIALKNHPSLRKSKAQTKMASAALEQVKTSNRVKVNMTGSANTNGDFDDFDTRTNTGTVGLNAEKLLYDSGVNRLNRNIQSENMQGAAEGERHTQVTVAADAKRAYYDLVLRILNRDVEREKLNNLEEHAKTAKGIYEVGNSPYVEVTKAEADLANARVSLLKAENDILVSQEALRVAMGIDIFDTVNLVLSTQLLLPDTENDIDTLLRIALEDRADYRRILHTIKMRELEIQVAARGNSPTIKGSIGSELRKQESYSVSTNYTAGININIPVSDGGLTLAQTNSARAQLEQDTADADSLRQTITHDVRSAMLSLSNAVDRVKSSELSVKYAEENLELAWGRYEVGVGNQLEVSDAVSTLATSRYSLYQALYDSQIARANLDEAMGHLPVEINSEGSM